MVKNLPEVWETWVRSLGGGDCLEKATHSSVLAWKIPWTEEPSGLQSMELQRVRHDWLTLSLSLAIRRYMVLLYILPVINVATHIFIDSLVRWIFCLVKCPVNSFSWFFYLRSSFYILDRSSLLGYALQIASSHLWFAFLLSMVSFILVIWFLV